MKLVVLSSEDLRLALPMGEAVTAMKEAFAELSAGRTVSPHPTVIPVPSPDAGPANNRSADEDEAKKDERLGTTLVKSAFAPGALGSKLVSVFPQNRERGLPVTPGIVVMLDPETGLPTAILEGTWVTALRTGAASGAATDLLARRDAEICALFGAGGQAVTQAKAVDCVRELKEIRVCARSRDSAERFVEDNARRLRAPLVVVDDADAALDGADVVCAATTSTEPVFDGRRLAAGTHVNGVGSYRLDMREIDAFTVARSQIFVDSRPAALGEAGDLVLAANEGYTREDEWTELGEVVLGQKPGRTDNEEITFFKSVGLAVQDVKAATLALERARELGLGTVIEL